MAEGKENGFLRGLTAPFRWLGGHARNGFKKFKNWIAGQDSSIEMGRIMGLKDSVEILIKNFAIALQKTLVKNAKESGKKIEAASKQMANDNLKQSLTGVSSNKGQKAMEQATSKVVGLNGKVVDRKIIDARNKVNAMSKANASMGLSNPTNVKAPTR